MFGGGYWEVIRRYKEFDSLRSFVEMQCPGVSLSPFPGKTVWRVRGGSLEKRRMGLERYMDLLLQSNTLTVANVTDAVSSFLEVQYTHSDTSYRPHLISPSPL